MQYIYLSTMYSQSSQKKKKKLSKSCLRVESVINDFISLRPNDEAASLEHLQRVK